MLANVCKALKVEAVPAADCLRLEDAWIKLSFKSQEPAPMQLADMQLPLLLDNPKAKVLTVRQLDGLLLALPVQSARNFDRSAKSDFTCNSLPLISQCQAQESVLALVNQLKRPLLLKDLPLDSQFVGQLKLAAGHLRVVQDWQRAALTVNGTYQDWLDNNFDKKRRKEFKRLRNRLAEQGDLNLETLNQTSDFTRFAKDFIELEAKGWKGKRGTAIAGQFGRASTFNQICQRLHQSGRLRFWILRFNGKAIAALFGVVSGSQAQIVKITYDEAFAKYSPGVLLVLDATAAFFAEPGLQFVDSCAIPDHPMINRIWRGRMALGDVLIAPAHYPAWKFQNLYFGLKLHSKCREIAKSLYLKLTGRKKS